MEKTQSTDIYTDKSERERERKTVISSVKCRSYERDAVCNAVSRAIEASECFPDVRGKKVLLKPNLVSSSSDCIERAVCTHPEVVYAVGKYVIDHGGIVTIADSPAGRSSPGILKKLYRETGIEAVAVELGVELIYDVTFGNVANPNAKVVINFPISDEVRNADIIISLPKLKTHVFMYYTGAVKNTFGCIPGLHKSVMHRRIQTKSDFAHMLVDLNEIVKPDFVLMDAITGQEGEGPNNGYSREIGYVFASNSIYSMDWEVIKFLGIEPELIPTTTVSLLREKFNPDEIEVVGDALSQLSDFKLPKKVRDQPDWRVPANKNTIIYKCTKIAGMQQKPKIVIDAAKCTGCGECVQFCQSHAISVKSEKAEIDYAACIGCFACIESCKTKAISMELELKGLGKITYPIKQKALEHPKILEEICVGCAQCANICSVRAIKIENKKAVVDVLKCIHCFCCHEVCNYGAIDVTDGRLIPRFLLR